MNEKLAVLNLCSRWTNQTLQFPQTTTICFLTCSIDKIAVWDSLKYANFLQLLGTVKQASYRNGITQSGID